MKTAIAAEVLLLVLFCGGGVASAQGAPPAGAGAVKHSNGANPLDDESDVFDTELQAYDYGLPATANVGYFGSRAGEENFVATRLHFLEAATNVASNDYEAETGVSGNVGIRRLWHDAAFNAAYYGGGNFYTGNSSQDTMFHSVTLAQTFQKRRHLFSITDNFNYVPSSPLSAVGFGSSPSHSASDPTGAPPTIPEQGVVLSNSSSTANSVGGTWLYTPNTRAEFSASGSYGLVRYADIGSNDNNAYSFAAEYEHALGRPSDRLGFRYEGTLIRYEQLGADLDTHSFLLEFIHNIHRRFVLRVAAGPEYSYASGLSGASGLVTPSVNVGFSRLWRHAEASIFYLRSVNEGSGVLVGSKSDLVEIYARDRFSRNWQAMVTAGYAHNSPLQSSLLTSYNSETFGVTVNRRISRTLELFLLYNVQYQDTVSGLNGSQVQQIGGIGLTVIPRVIAFR